MVSFIERITFGNVNVLFQYFQLVNNFFFILEMKRFEYSVFNIDEAINELTVELSIKLRRTVSSIKSSSI